MKIKRFAYHDKARDWQLEPIDFDDLDLVLLVGVSGVGKTKILDAIMNLKRIASGISLNGVRWDIIFEAEDGNEYRWYGEYDLQDDDEKVILGELLAQFYTNKDSNIKEELIYKNQDILWEKYFSKIIKPINYNNLSFSPVQSILSFLDTEEIKQMKKEIEKIHSNEYKTYIIDNSEVSLIRNIVYSSKKSEIFDKNLREIDTKMIFLYLNDLESFQKIKDIFMNTFCQVEDIRIYEYKDNQYITQFKEKGNKKWFLTDSLSSGMLKVLAYITDLYLIPEHGLILIDEFENSLGINCLDSITEILNTDNRNLQFILTSHHPYIINNINMKSWRIVTRRGGVVTVKNAEDLGLGRSKHDAFMQLINSDEYTEGIAVEEFETV
jgi:ABC-type lipoprotein export system ATPase subunit